MTIPFNQKNSSYSNILSDYSKEKRLMKYPEDQKSWSELSHKEREHRLFQKQDFVDKSKTSNLEPEEVEGWVLKDRKTRLQNECAMLEKELQMKKEQKMKLEEHLHDAMLKHQTASAGNLAVGLAHEIRNPLTTVKGFIQLLRPYLVEINKMDYADVALEELNRANELLGEFLAVLKPGSSNKKLIGMKRLTTDMMKLFESEALLRRVQLTMELPEQELHVWGDEKKLKQVVLNLLKNAFEAIEESSNRDSGSINVILLKKGNRILLSIQDNGVGVEKSHEEQILTPFFTTKEKGTGIGLVICKSILDDHKGFLEIYSSQESPGATFSISLPCCIS